MSNNTIIRRLRYIFDFDDNAIMALFALGGREISHNDLEEWLAIKKGSSLCSDECLAAFLDGIIHDMRGPKESSSDNKPANTQGQYEGPLSNNMILRKLRIALNFQTDDMLDIFKLMNYEISKHELSALFRKVGHKHYRECDNQTFYNFLNGLQLKYRDGTELKQTFEEEKVCNDDNKDESDVWAR